MLADIFQYVSEKNMVPVFRSVSERFMAKNYRHVSLCSAVSKVFEKIVNNRFVNQLEKGGLLSDFQFGVRSFHLKSFVDNLTVVKAFKRFLTTQAVVLDISKAFERAWHAGPLHKFKSYGISVGVFSLILSFFSNKRHRGSGWEVFVRMSIKCVVFQDSIIGSTFALLHLINFKI